jgi:ribosomal protein S18 acetylase RimI-like enzyme
MDEIATPNLTTRPLARSDLGDVVAIDAVAEGRPRRTYFERRLAAALRQPARHVQLAASDQRGLAGYILARVLDGEFGRTEPGLRLEAIGVRSDAMGHGVGTRLLDALIDHGRRHRIADVHTQAKWTNHAMLRWLDAKGFALAPGHVVDCAVDGGAYAPARDDAAGARQAEGQGSEIDYGGQAAGNDFEHLARDNADVSAMRWDDLDDVVRIDRGITGRDRRDYMQQQLAEAMQDSAVRVSLTARRDGIVAGFVMARVDLGDFGRVEPVAIVDTIGVDPDYAHHGIGHALMSQLFANLGALRIERVETLIAPRDFGLLGFLYDVGFGPSQRLSFVRRIRHDAPSLF